VVHFRTIELKNESAGTAEPGLTLGRIVAMGPEQDLAAFKAEFARTAPPGRPTPYEVKLEGLSASFAPESAVGVDDQAPEFVPPDPTGKPVIPARSTRPEIQT
jgi:hypothetical protein